MPRITDALEETIARLDALGESRRARHAADFAALQAIVAGLDGPIIDESEPDAFAPRGPRPDVDRRPDEDAPFGGVDLPEPRAGHEFGPRVRAKLLAQALERGDW